MGCFYPNRDGPTFTAFRFRVHAHKLGKSYVIDFFIEFIMEFLIVCSMLELIYGSNKVCKRQTSVSVKGSRSVP